MSALSMDRHGYLTLNDKIVAQIVGTAAFPESERRRLVACWNACLRATTEELERARYPWPHMYIDAKRERDELLEALDRLVTDAKNKWGDPHTLREAEDLLAKHSKAPA